MLYDAFKNKYYVATKLLNGKNFKINLNHHTINGLFTLTLVSMPMAGQRIY